MNVPGAAELAHVASKDERRFAEDGDFFFREVFFFLREVRLTGPWMEAIFRERFSWTGIDTPAAGTALGRKRRIWGERECRQKRADGKK